MFTPVTQINRDETKKLKELVFEAIQPLADQLGISLSYAGGVYDGSSCTLKLQFAVKSAAGVTMTREAQDLVTFGATVGADPTWLGKSFTYTGRTYTVTGAKLRSKAPILGTRDDGKVFKFPVELIKALVK